MGELTEDQFRQQLETVAQRYASDIKGDNPDVDVSYECYVFDIDHRGLLGYIYMGDAGDWAMIDKEGIFGGFDTCDEDVQLWEAVANLHWLANYLSPYRRNKL